MYMYDPSTISSRELPVWGKAVGDFDVLWGCRNAKSFCKRLQSLLVNNPEFISDYNSYELQGIKDVADGKVWPVPDEVYTNYDWDRDKSISAVPGQEIEESIYYAMFNVLPPYRLPRCERTEEYSAGFLVSEPDSADPLGRGELYSAYGKKDGKYYYIGLLPHKI